MKLLQLVKSAAEFVDHCKTLRKLPAYDQRRERLAHEVEVDGMVLQRSLQARAELLQAPDGIKHILVAINQSEQSQWAIDEAVTLAALLDARISLVTVIESTPLPAPEYAYDDAIRRPALFEAARTLLNSSADRVPADLLGDRIVREGKAASEIVETASEIHAELIVIATHARGAIGRFLLGSTAEAVVRHAACPVLTISHPRPMSTPETYAIKATADPLPA